MITARKLNFFLTKTRKSWSNNICIQGSLSWLQKIPQGLSRTPEALLSGPCCNPAMFKYSDKQQVGGLRSAVSLPKTATSIIAQQLRALLRTLQVDFQDFPGPRLFSRTFQVLKFSNKKFQGLPRLSRRRGNLVQLCISRQPCDQLARFCCSGQEIKEKHKMDQSNGIYSVRGSTMDESR